MGAFWAWRGRVRSLSLSKFWTDNAFLFKEGRGTQPTPDPILGAGMRLGRPLTLNPPSPRLSLRAASLATWSHPLV